MYSLFLGGSKKELFLIYILRLCSRINIEDQRRRHKKTTINSFSQTLVRRHTF